jgi:hypothetical protein
LSRPAFGKLWLLKSDENKQNQRYNLQLVTLDNLGNPTIHWRSPIAASSTLGNWGDASDMVRVGRTGIAIVTAPARAAMNVLIDPYFFSKEYIDTTTSTAGNLNITVTGNVINKIFSTDFLNIWQT